MQWLFFEWLNYFPTISNKGIDFPHHTSAINTLLIHSLSPKALCSPADLSHAKILTIAAIYIDGGEAGSAFVSWSFTYVLHISNKASILQTKFLGISSFRICHLPVFRHCFDLTDFTKNKQPSYKFCYIISLQTWTSNWTRQIHNIHMDTKSCRCATKWTGWYDSKGQC